MSRPVRAILENFRWTSSATPAATQVKAPAETLLATPAPAATLLRGRPAAETALRPSSAARQLVEESSNDGVPAHWQPGDVILDLYEVQRELGHGGMGVVHLVLHRGWNTGLAVKSPLPAILEAAGGAENFVQEAETWVNLGLHPNVATCHYVRTLGGIPRVFAECVEGGSLKSWITSGRLYEGGPSATLERILDIAIQFAWGLHHAHESGLIHQDVKPDNVLMAPDGTPKVTDFGLAGAKPSSMPVADPTDVAKGTMLSTFVAGTLQYWSPEQADAAARRAASVPEEQIAKITRRTDIWSWAVSVLEMFRREPPQYGQSAHLVLESFVDADSEPSPIPPEVVALLRDCFALNIERRPPTMAAAADALRQAYASILGHDYTREAPESLKFKADSLNNRGLSLLDLGKNASAMACMEEALRIDPQHVGATFNSCRQRWLAAEITDDEFVRRLLRIEHANADNPDYWRSVAWLAAERGDVSHLAQLATRARVQGDLAELARRGGLLAALRLPISHSIRYPRQVGFSAAGGQLWALWGDSLTVWDTASLAELSTVQPPRAGHDRLTQESRLSPDGRTLLASGQRIESGSELMAFDAADWRRLWQRDLAGEVEQIVFSADSTRAALTVRNPESDDEEGDLEEDTYVCVLDLRTGKECLRVGGAAASALSRDGRLLALTSGEVWDTSSSTKAGDLEGHERVLHPDGSVSPNGALLATWSEQTIRLRELGSGRALRRFDLPTRGDLSGCSVVDVAFSPDGRLFVCAGNQSSVPADHFPEKLPISGQDAVFVFEAKYETKAAIPDPYPLLSRASGAAEALQRQVRVTSLVASAETAIDNEDFVAALRHVREAQRITGYERSNELRAMLCAYASQARAERVRFTNAWHATTLRTPRECVFAMDVHPMGTSLITASSSDELKSRGKTVLQRWDLNTGKEVARFIHPNRDDAVYRLRFSSDGRLVLSADGQGHVHLWDAETGGLIQEFQRVACHFAGVLQLWFAPQGPRALWCDDHSVRITDLTSGEELLRIAVECLVGAAVSPNGAYLAFAGQDGMRWTNIAERQDSGSLPSEPHTWPRWLSGENRLLRVSMSGWQVWDLKASAYSGPKVECDTDELCVSRDGRHAITTGTEGDTRVWDLETGERLFQFHLPPASRNVALSLDCQRLMTSQAAEVQVWELDWEWSIERHPVEADVRSTLARQVESVTPSIGAALTNELPIGRPLEALRIADQVLRANVHDPKCWVQKGAALAELGRLDEAILAFDHAIGLDAGDHVPWGKKAACCYELAQDTEAEASYARALAILDAKHDSSVDAPASETRAEMCRVWGTFCSLRGKDRSALALYERALTHPVELNNPALHFNLAIVAASTGEIGRAVTAAERATELMGNDGACWALLAAVLTLAGRDAAECLAKGASSTGAKPQEISSQQRWYIRRLRERTTAEIEQQPELDAPAAPHVEQSFDAVRMCAFCGSEANDLTQSIDGQISLCDSCIREARAILDEAAPQEIDGRRVSVSASTRESELVCTFCQQSCSEMLGVSSVSTFVCYRCVDSWWKP